MKLDWISFFPLLRIADTHCKSSPGDSALNSYPTGVAVQKATRGFDPTAYAGLCSRDMSWESPKNGEKLQNSPPRSDPRKWGKIAKNCIFGVILPLFWGNFPHFRGSDRGGEICNFSTFFGDFRPGGFPGPLRGKTTRKTCWGIELGIPRTECAEVFASHQRVSSCPESLREGG